MRYVSDTFNNFELWSVSEQETKKKTGEPFFHVGGKKQKKKLKSLIFFLVGPDFFTSEGSLTKEYTECHLM